MLLIIGYLGFISLSLLPDDTDNRGQLPGKPIAANAEANPQQTQTIQVVSPTLAPPSPTASPFPSATPTLPLPSPTSQPTVLPSTTDLSGESQVSVLATPTETPVMDFGDWSCRYCDKMPAKVKMTHYWPPLGGENCWWFYEGYCHSPMKSSVPWETLVEIAAACPPHWLGGVVEVPDIGRRFLCLDTGDKVVCEDNVCVVDVLTQTRYDWDGLIFDAVVYYPRVWTDGTRPQVTPFAAEDED